jgi:hypothetical protein
VSCTWSVLCSLVPRSKPSRPPSTAPGPSHTNFTLDLLHCPRPSWRTQHLHIHKAKRHVAQNTRHNSTRHLRLAISIIKHIWNMIQPKKSQTSQLLCQSFITHTWAHLRHVFTRWTIPICSALCTQPLP